MHETRRFTPVESFILHKCIHSFTHLWFHSWHKTRINVMQMLCNYYMHFVTINNNFAYIVLFDIQFKLRLSHDYRPWALQADFFSNLWMKFFFILWSGRLEFPVALIYIRKFVTLILCEWKVVYCSWTLIILYWI